NELLKREVETNIVNDKEHTLKEDQKTTHHYSMSFKEILLISITSLYFLAFIPLAISGYVILDDLFEIDMYTDTVVNLLKASYILIALLILVAFFISFLLDLFFTY